jgi:FAD/FMN-containing dehydrogenase
VQSLFENWYPRGWFHYWKSDFLQELSDEAIETLVAHSIATPTPKTSIIFLEHYHGAAQRVAPSDTAFANRSHKYNFVINALSPNASDTAKNIAWVRGFWDAMRPYSAGRVYVNYLGEEGTERVQEAYGSNYNRLLALKRKFDPNNFFRMNQNIPPASKDVVGAA